MALTCKFNDMADETGHVVGCDYCCSPSYVKHDTEMTSYIVSCVCFYANLHLYLFVNISTAKLMHEISRFVFTSFSPLFRFFLTIVISTVGIVNIQFVVTLRVLGLYFSWHYKLISLVKCEDNGIVWIESWSWSVYKINDRL